MAPVSLLVPEFTSEGLQVDLAAPCDDWPSGTQIVDLGVPEALDLPPPPPLRQV